MVAMVGGVARLGREHEAADGWPCKLVEVYIDDIICL